MHDHELSLDTFLKSVEKRALRMAEMATGSRDDALELVQEAMLGLVRRYSARSSESWPPLFYRILQNQVRDWHRRQAVRRKWSHWVSGVADEEQGHMDMIADPGAADPARQLLLSKAGQMFVAELRRLPLRQQQAFMLRAWEGLDVADTAKAMSCSQGSVKTHYSRAVHRLREALEDYWP